MPVTASRAFVALITVLLPWTAAAQNVFVLGGAAVQTTQFPHFESQSPVVLDENPSGTKGAWVITAGGVLARHAVLQLEVSGSGTLHKDFEPARLLPPVPPPRFNSERSIDFRSRDVAILGGYTTGSTRRVNASALFGMVIVQERTHSLSVIVPAPSPTVLPSDSTTTLYRTGPIFGFDLPTRVASRVNVVPQVRGYKCASGPVVVRAGVSAGVLF